jgi:LPS-assembly lipoprotein
MMKRNLMVLGLATLLSACGFQLRGTGDTHFALTELDVSARNVYGETVKEVRSQLENSRVKVSSGAPYQLILTHEDTQRRNASYTGAGRSAEIELTSTLDYEIRGANNLLLLQNQQEVQSVYAQDQSNLGGSEQEAVQQTVELRQRLVRNLLQHLQMITPQQLEQLQQTAQAKADAEAKAAAEAAAAAREAELAQPQQSPLQLLPRE